MGAQAVVGLAAVGLVVANEWQDRALYADVLKSTAKKGSNVNPVSYRNELTRLAEMVVGVIVITVVAGVSDRWATIMAILVFILWMLFLIHTSGTKTAAKTTTARKGVAA